MRVSAEILSTCVVEFEARTDRRLLARKAECWSPTGFERLYCTKRQDCCSRIAPVKGPVDRSNGGHKMKRTLLVVLTILALSAGVFAQTATDEIEKALLPAPRNMKEGATVIKWKPDFTYETLRKGTNRMVCYDRSNQPGQQPFAVECTSIANLERVAQSLKIEAIADQKERRAAFEAAEKAGTWTKPEFG